MILINLKIAVRNLLRQKSSSIISIFGLAVSFACSLFIYFYIDHEYSFDRYHPRSNDTYRLVWHLDDDVTWVPTGGAWQKRLVNIPEVEEVVLLDPKWGGDPFINVGEISFREQRNRVFRTTSNYNDLFELIFKTGDKSTALENPGSVIISSTMASKYFPLKDPIGQVLVLDHKHQLKITGVFMPFPSNSHFQADILYNIGDKDWVWPYLYLRLIENSGKFSVDQKIDNLFKLTNPKSYADGHRVSLQALTAIHLHSNYDYEINTNSDLLTVKTIAGIGIIILVMGCINFLNIVIASSSTRLKEISIKKVMGSDRLQIINQILTEVLLITVLSAILGLFLLIMIAPTINYLSGLDISLSLNIPTIIIYISAVALIGLITGCYPAFLLSKTKTIHGLRKIKSTGLKEHIVQKIVLIFQYSASIFLIAGTVLIHEQLGFLNNRNLGFDKEQVIGINIAGDGRGATTEEIQLLKYRWSSLGDVVKVTTATSLPTKLATIGYDAILPKSDPSSPPIMMYTNAVDHDFAQTMGLNILVGEDFDNKNSEVTKNKALINEVARDVFQLHDPIGEKIIVNGWKDTVTVEIIGVIENFNDRTLKEKVPPMVFLSEHENPWYMALRLNVNALSKSLSDLKAIWESVVPQEPFDYFFFDDAFRQLYDEEQKLSRVTSIFSLIAIFIAALGTFGLSFHLANIKVKEIGIRKVLGAGLLVIVRLLGGPVIRLIGISFILVAPFFYLATMSWLEEFAYRIDFSWMILFTSLLAILLIAVMSSGYHIIKAAIANPIDSLNDE